jgi:excisionase family DNA binding protein
MNTIINPPAGGRKDKMKNCKYNSFEELPLMLSVPEVATVLSISRAGAYELVKERGFPSLTIGSRILVPRDKLIAWIDEKSSGDAE